MKVKYGILDEDIYNIDKKSFIIRVGGSAKVVFSKSEKQAFVKQCGTWEWASLIESVGFQQRLSM